MVTVFFIFIIIVCAVLAFFVLIQNPKGGGLAGSFSGIGTQMMGAKQSTDVVEKGTWITAACLLAFILVSFAMTPKANTAGKEKTRSEKLTPGRMNTTAPAPKPAATTPAPTNTNPPAPGTENPPAPGPPAPAKP
jgi:preprotein translocase subunit SecG